MKSATLAATLLAGHAAAILRNRMVPPPYRDDTARAMDNTRGSGTFDQLIDHADPTLGSFPQRFWWSSEYYAGPGSPVVFFTPGESDADGYTGYLTNRTLPGQFAQAVGGAIVLVEHRYWGTSTPFTQLTTKNLRFLTLANAIHDATRFAREVRFPFDTNGTSAAPRAPWVFSGGSYSGALAAWVESVDPGTFWAYHASSAVVEAVGDFWQYFSPVMKGMAQNCSADIGRVIEHVDGVLRTGSAEEKTQLKGMFGLEMIEHDDDFASAIEGGPWTWQSHDISSGYADTFQFCDHVENVFPKTDSNDSKEEAPETFAVPGPEGVGLTKALAGYAKWVKNIMAPGSCAKYGYWRNLDDMSCFDTYNASSPMYMDVSMKNSVLRQWMWLLCNEPFKYWQNGAPEGEPTIVSRLVNNAYWERQCPLYFPPEDGYTYGIASGKDTVDVNTYTGGWKHVNTTRVTWVNGEFDPWRDSTVSSTSRPGGMLVSTPETPVDVIPGGIHCSDLILRNGLADPAHMKVITNQINIIKNWVQEFYNGKH